MVTNVLAVSAYSQIDSLIVIDHGHPSAIRFGKDSVTANSFDEFYKPTFRCNAGLQTHLLLKFAIALGVPCYGGTGDYFGALARNTGTYVKCKLTEVMKHGTFVGTCEDVPEE